MIATAVVFIAGFFAGIVFVNLVDAAAARALRELTAGMKRDDA